MTENAKISSQTIRLDHLEKIEPICSEFEAEWRRGAQPDITQFMNRWEGPESGCLFSELLKLDVEYRGRCGDMPDRDSYKERFPEYVELIDNLLDEHDQRIAFSSTVTVEALAPRVGSDRYALQQFHARGGMGEVWIAVDNEIGRHVALKRLRGTGGDAAHARFLVEAQIAGKLEHPGIVPVYDLGIDDLSHPYYVMKFIEGTTLKTAIADFYKAETLSPGEVSIRFRDLLGNFLELCEAVAFAHSRGVIHRDLKPDNVMLGAFGETLILDWGLAKLLHQPDLPDALGTIGSTGTGGSAETSPGSVIGTPNYMPPELAEGQIEKVGERTDVYLLGATLYEILTAQPPRKGRSKEDMLELARTAPPVAPRSIRKDVAKPLEAICLKAMAMQPDDRYRDVMQVAADIRSYLAGEPVSALTESLVVKSTRWAKRHHRTLSSSAAALIIIGLTFFGYTQRGEVLQRRAVAQAREEASEFRQLYDELAYSGARIEEPNEEVPYFSPASSAAVGERLLNLSETWGPNLEYLRLPETERKTVRQELYEAVLLIAQTRQHELTPQLASREKIDQLHADLDRAQNLLEPEPPTSSLQRLRGKLLIANTEVSEPTDALDYFLDGEEARMKAKPIHDTVIAFPVAVRKDLQPAIGLYREALRLNPDHYWSHLQLGRCYLGAGNPAKAVETLGTCIAVRPKSPWGYISRGLALTVDQRYDEALLDLNNVIDGAGRLNTTDRIIEVAKLHRCVVYWKQQKIQDAEAGLSKLSQSDVAQMREQSIYLLGQIQYQNGRVNQAIASLTQCDKITELEMSVCQTLAQAHYITGQQVKGQEYLDRYLLLAFPDREHDRAIIRSEFLRRLSKTLPPNTKPPTKTQLLGIAQTTMQQHIATQPSPKAHLELAKVFQALTKPDRVIEECTRGLKLAPDGAMLELFSLRGGMYYSIGDTEQAEANYVQVAKLVPQTEGERILQADAMAFLGYFQALDHERVDAMLQASRTTLALASQTGKHHATFHTVACIYGELSRVDSEHQQNDQRVALDFLEEAIQRAISVGPVAIRNQLFLCRQETAFPPSMKATTRYQQLVSQLMPKTTLQTKKTAK